LRAFGATCSTTAGGDGCACRFCVARLWRDTLHHRRRRWLRVSILRCAPLARHAPPPPAGASSNEAVSPGVLQRSRAMDIALPVRTDRRAPPGRSPVRSRPGFPGRNGERVTS